MSARIIAVVGATATGKTALAIDLAEAVDGEIINADSRQFYRGMDIGTAKPTAEERQRIPHHFLDIANPDETVTLATFVDAARDAIAGIASRRKQPIVVGGTGQYIWALLEGWRVPRVPPDTELRARLEALAATSGPDALAAELRALDSASADAIDPRNIRRVIRAIEVTRATGRPFSEWQQKDPPSPAPWIVGLQVDRPALHALIDARVDRMIAAGLVEEVRALIEGGYACALPSMTAIGYRQVCEHLRGECTLDEAVARVKTETHRLARMQHAWFKPSDTRITWLPANAPDLLHRALAAISA